MAKGTISPRLAKLISDKREAERTYSESDLLGTYDSALHWQRQWGIESERASRATSQIREALAILDSPSFDREIRYDLVRIAAILKAGL